MEQNSPDLQRSFIGCVQVFLEKTAANLKSLTLAGHSMHLMLFSYSKEYYKILIQRRRSLLGFLAVKTGKTEDTSNAEIGGPLESVYGNSTFQVFHAEE